MRFVWDERKRRSNKQKHKVDFAILETIDWNHAKLFEVQNVEGEERDMYVVPQSLNLLTTVVVERGASMRVVSLRYASSFEEQWYFEQRW